MLKMMCLLASDKKEYPDPLVRDTDPGIRIRIPNTALQYAIYKCFKQHMLVYVWSLLVNTFVRCTFVNSLYDPHAHKIQDF
jgi:hypothetical protein